LADKLDASFWFPPGGSTGAQQVDQLFFFILTVAVVFFALVVSVMVAFVIMYRRREGAQPGRAPSHNTALEILWSVIPAILVAIIFIWGFFSYLDMREPPENSYEIQVVARKWSWLFIYPNGYSDSDLHVPLEWPVSLVMSSDDVIHSLFIPAFRLKQDVVPGRYTKTWFKATAPGTYRLFCAEYCGEKHSTMLASVIVHESGKFESWLQDAANFLEKMTPVEAGQLLYVRRGCVQCHSVDGSARQGPSFKGVFGTEQLMADGERVAVDENYLRESILEPQSKIRDGYKPVMPLYSRQPKNEAQAKEVERELSAIIAYIKSLK
jgi:cytochrome c oxidase subunit 2